MVLGGEVGGEALPRGHGGEGRGFWFCFLDRILQDWLGSGFITAKSAKLAKMGS